METKPQPTDPPEVITLFSNMVEDTFIKQLRGEVTRPQTSQKLLEGDFYIASTANERKFLKFYWEMHDHYLFLHKKASGPEVAFMDIEFAFLKMTFDKEVDGVPCFGLRFVKRKTYEEIFSPNKALVQQWFQTLKRYCILTKFKEKYETKGVLGRGNFAKVFSVVSKESGKEFAVKAFHKSAIMKDPHERKCLQYEIKMLREMNCTRLVRLEELYEGENYVYCLLELYRGSDLFKTLIQKGHQPEPKVLAILQQILEALDYMHEKKIIHRDLKPENIMFKNLNNSIDIGVVDLGFATFEADYKNLFSCCGTPGYVAPEILNEEPYDCKVDIYSAGIIFYILITGIIPFYGFKYEDIVSKNLKGVIDFDFEKMNISISTETIDLIKRMLEKNPAKRISARQALYHPAFQNVLSKSPMISKISFDSKNLISQQKVAEKKKESNLFMPFPDRIEELSPVPVSPSPVRHKNKFANA